MRNVSILLDLFNLGHVLPIEEVSNILQKTILVPELGLYADGLQR